VPGHSLILLVVGFKIRKSYVPISSFIIILRSNPLSIKTRGLNKTNATLNIQKSLKKLTLKMFGFTLHPKKNQRRKLVHISTEAIRKVLSEKPKWKHAEDFPQHVGSIYPLIQDKIFNKLEIHV